MCQKTYFRVAHKSPQIYFADELHELLRREQEQNINITDSDPAVDAYLKANAASSPDHIATETVLKLLGLEVCADTIVGDQLLRGISGGQKKRVTSGTDQELLLSATAQ